MKNLLSAIVNVITQQSKYFSAKSLNTNLRKERLSCIQQLISKLKIRKLLRDDCVNQGGTSFFVKIQLFLMEIFLPRISVNMIIS